MSSRTKLNHPHLRSGFIASAIFGIQYAIFISNVEIYLRHCMSYRASPHIRSGITFLSRLSIALQFYILSGHIISGTLLKCSTVIAIPSQFWNDIFFHIHVYSCSERVVTMTLWSFFSLCPFLEFEDSFPVSCLHLTLPHL